MPKAALLKAPKQIEIIERPELQPKEHELVIALEAAGICGTDLAVYHGDYVVPLPLVLGHEFAGRVTRAGKSVDPRWIGERVTAEINNTCLAQEKKEICYACAIGMPNHCQDRTTTGIVNHDGAFAEEMLVSVGALHKIPETIDPAAATLIEPLAAALQTFEMTPVEGDERIVVLGPGRLGILIVFAASLLGLDVLAVSRSEEKRARALAFGASDAFTPEEAESAVKERTGGLGADMVVEATGRPDGILTALTLVRPRGTIACKSTCGLPALGLDMTKLVVDEIHLQGSRCGPFEKAIAVLSAHHGALSPLISATYPFKEIPSALEAASRENKVVLTMR